MSRFATALFASVIAMILGYTCAYRKSNASILVMQSTQDRI